MSSSPIPSTLDARTQAFPVLTPAQISRVRIPSKLRRVTPGEILFAPDDTNVPFFVLLSGSMEIEAGAFHTEAVTHTLSVTWGQNGNSGIYMIADPQGDKAMKDSRKGLWAQREASHNARIVGNSEVSRLFPSAPLTRTYLLSDRVIKLNQSYAATAPPRQENLC